MKNREKEDENQILRDLRDNINKYKRQSKISVIESQKERRKIIGHKIFEKIMLKKVSFSGFKKIQI